MHNLRLNTSATIKMGPFVSSADGYTEQTGLTISQSDVRLAKNGGDYAQKDETTAATHDEKGWYNIQLSASDIDTEGRLDVLISEIGSLQVWVPYMVMSEQEYDSLYGDQTLTVSANNLGEVSNEANLK